MTITTSHEISRAAAVPFARICGRNCLLASCAHPTPASSHPQNSETKLRLGHGGASDEITTVSWLIPPKSVTGRVIIVEPPQRQVAKQRARLGEAGPPVAFRKAVAVTRQTPRWPSVPDRVRAKPRLPGTGQLPTGPGPMVSRGCGAAPRLSENGRSPFSSRRACRPP
jgi:hypothetical protein